MGGGILQLAAFGSQDIMLTGNPQITFFRQLYKRHTGFAIESIEQAFNGDADFGRQVSATISRTGDLITRMYLEVTLRDLTLYTFKSDDGQTLKSTDVNYVNSIGHALLKSVELEIGGFRVDRHVAEWMDVWHELSEVEERREGLNAMIGKYAERPRQAIAFARVLSDGSVTVEVADGGAGYLVPPTIVIGNPTVAGLDVKPATAQATVVDGKVVKIEMKEDGSPGSYDPAKPPPSVAVIGEQSTQRRWSTNKESTYYIPLLFFMNRHTGLALPLISLQFHETRVLFEFRNVLECIVHPTQKITSAYRGSASDPVNIIRDPLSFKRARLFVDYIYLDTEERKRFAQIPHEMLIEQVQFLGNVPIAGYPTVSQKVPVNFSHPVKELIWMYTSQDHADANDIFNYNLDDDDRDVFTSVRLLLNGTDRFAERQGSYFRLVQPYQHHTRVPTKKIYSYSFALSPEEHQPSGTLNMSRIDQAYFLFNFEDPIPTWRGNRGHSGKLSM
jgi:hypothetical protein